jgi:hypothetical protein
MTNFLINSNPLHKYIFFFFFSIFLTTANSFGQELNYIYGKVVDSKTGAPLAFASIVQKNKSVGLISNDDGSFKLPKYFDVANVTIVISFIGYYSEEIQVSNLKKDGLNIIKLIEKTEFLNEIVIKNTKKPLTPHDIVQLAIDNIKNNYPFDPFTYVGYYRDYQKNEDQEYLNLNEAILKVHDRGFQYKDFISTNTSILKYEQNLDFPVDEAAAKIYDYKERTKVIDNAELGYLTDNTNEFILLRVHDAIRNYNINTFDFVNKLETDFLRNHNFVLNKETSIEDVRLYEIKALRRIHKIFAVGTIYISHDDYKIYKFQYKVYQYKSRRKIRDTESFESIEKILGNKGELIFDVIVEYTNYNETMYPKYISFKNSFESLQPPKFVPIDAQFNFVDHPEKEVILFVDILFNNKVDPKKADRKKNYLMGYQGAPIDIDSIHVMNDTVRVFPNDDDVIYAKKAWLNGMRLVGKDFSMELRNIKDVDGNTVFKGEMARFMQYREFFIQELKTLTKRPKNPSNMDKYQPLSKNQPIDTSVDISQYWMNTPLKGRIEDD